jgi:hypothetical protein
MDAPRARAPRGSRGAVRHRPDPRLASLLRVVCSAHPEKFKSGSAAIYGLAESLPDREMVGTLTKSFLDTLYKT